MLQDTIHKETRQFSLTNLAVDNGMSVFVLTLMILFFGFSSYKHMPKEMYPEINIPYIYISTFYFGNSATDIESLVTQPLEKQLSGISGITEIASNSMQDFSVITVKFRTDITERDAVQQVKDVISKTKKNLPEDISQEPLVEAIRVSELPILTVNVSGNYNLDQLRIYSEYLQEKLEVIGEIANVQIKGIQKRAVNIEVDLLKMEALQLNFRDIEYAIKSENITLSAGEIKNEDYRRIIRIFGAFDSVKDLERIIIKSHNQHPIYLKDFATITYDFKEKTNYARSDGNPVISLDVIKRAGMNVLAATDNVRKVVEQERTYLPKELKVAIFNDQSYYTKEEVNNLENSIILGVILVVLVLLFFLGLRNALFVGLAIPISMLIGILWLNIMGIALNNMVLIAMVLALGLLVDNAIVVVENIYRYRSKGYSGKVSGKNGVSEVALPIITSTVTTLIAFVPLLFWPGVMGAFMKFFPITLIIVLSSSLFVALVINPVFTSRLMKVAKPTNASNRSQYEKRKTILIIISVIGGMLIGTHFAKIMWLRNVIGISTVLLLIYYLLLKPIVTSFQKKGLQTMEKKYHWFLNKTLQFPITSFLSTVGLLIGSILLLSFFPPKLEFAPVTEPFYINTFIELPVGTAIEKTNRVVKDIEKIVNQVLQSYDPIVESVLTQVGENTADPSEFPTPGLTPNKARISVSFIPIKNRGHLSSADAMKDIRKALRNYPGVKITVDRNKGGPPVGKPINLEIIGEDINQIISVSEEVKGFIDKQNIAGIEELIPDTRLGQSGLSIHINREIAQRYGVSTLAIADRIRTAIYGKEISKLKKGKEEAPIFIRAQEKYRNNTEDILNQKITFRSLTTGQIIQVPISTLANIEFNTTYSSIKRKNGQQLITLASNITNGGNANEIVGQLKKLMKQYKFPKEVNYSFTGEQTQQAEDINFLSITFKVAVFGIFIILVTQFNSLLLPFIILLSILFSTIGVFIGYILTGMTFNVISSGIGIIALAGIVVNNAIVLVDYTKITIKNKQESLGLSTPTALSKEQVKACIMHSGATRLRPVLLTAITTILSLFPLALGININFTELFMNLDPQFFIGGDSSVVWGPMAWTVIFGLVFSTFLTLIIIPVMYWLTYNLTTWLTRLFSPKKTLDQGIKPLPIS